MARVWWYSNDPSGLASRRGPVTEDDISRGLGDGSLSMSTRVWREGFPEWRALNSVEELSTLRWTSLGGEPPARRRLLAVPRHRRLAAGLLLLLLLTGLVAARFVLQAPPAPPKSASVAADRLWTNPVTHATAHLPPGWQVEQRSGDDGPPSFVFTLPAAALVAEFEHEEVSAEIGRYAKDWLRSVSRQMSLQPSSAPAGFDTAERHVRAYDGALAGDAARHVSALLVLRSGRQAWRMVITGPEQAPAERPEVQALRAALLATL